MPAETPGLFLDDNIGRLAAEGLGVFDPATRGWQPGPTVGTPVSLPDAVRWLQRGLGTRCRVPIGLIGPRDASAAHRDTAYALGKGLAELGLIVLCGGKNGVMEAACEGAEAGGGLSIGLLPDEDWHGANRFVGVWLATGIGVARNAVIARAALALIAVGGGYGTLSEMAFGLQFGRPVLTLLDAPVVAGTHSMASSQQALDAVCRIVLALPRAT